MPTMLPADKRSASKKSSWRSWLKGLVAISVIAVGIVLALVARDLLVWRACSNTLHEAHLIGGPVTFDQFAHERIPARDLASKREALQVIKNLAAAFKGDELPSFSREAATPLGCKWPDRVDRAFQELFAPVAHDLARFDQLVVSAGCRLPHKAGGDPITVYYQNGEGKSVVSVAARLRAWDIVRRSMHHDAGSLADDLTSLQKYGDVLTEEPSLLASMARIGIDRRCLLVLEEVLGQTQLPGEQLRKCLPMLDRIEQDDRVSWAIRGERAFAIAACDWVLERKPIEQAIGLQNKVPDLGSFRWKTWVYRQEQLLVAQANALLQVPGTPERLEIARRQEIPESVMKDGRMAIVATLVPDYATVLRRDLEVIALARCARVALAAEMYRMNTGRFPVSIAKLVPQYLDRIPQDPFVARPLQYRTTPDGVIVYSVGDDATDEGGHIASLVEESTDVGLMLLKPERRGRPAPTQPATQTAGSRPNTPGTRPGR
jgi:hypothetical protein